MITDYDRILFEVALERGLLTDTLALEAHLFDKQRDFVKDPAKFKAAQCSRRAGKSEGGADILFTNAQKYPGSTALYVALTRASAKNIMWPKLLRLIELYKIQCTPLEASLEIKFPNASKIWLVGADMQNFIERLRGGAYSVGIIDEAQSMRGHIKSLIDDILTPAIADYDGSICLFGTPGPIPQGYFYDAVALGKHGFSVHKWTMRDNPHMPNAEKFMKDLLERNNWTIDNPTFRREYLNEWVLDGDALFYKIKDKNIIPKQVFGPEFSRVIGVDYGWNDKTAFAVLCYSRFSPKVFVEHTEAHGEMIPSQIAMRLQQLIQTYKPDQILADTGGLGKTITEEMIRRYSIPIVAAEKTDKFTWVSLLNGDMIDGNFLICETNKDLIDQYKTLQKWEKDATKEDPNMPNDLCDAVLYSHRYIRAYHFDQTSSPKTKQQIIDEEEDSIWQQEEKNYKQEKQKEWWER